MVKGKYSSLQIYLPKEEHGGYPAYPEFTFEFMETEGFKERMKYLGKNEFSSENIGGVESRFFNFKSEARYLLSDMRHAYDTLNTTGYLVPINSGHLICMLSTSSATKTELKKYINILRDYCISAIESDKLPHESRNRDARTR